MGIITQRQATVQTTDATVTTLISFGTSPALGAKRFFRAWVRATDEGFTTEEVQCWLIYGIVSTVIGEQNSRRVASQEVFQFGEAGSTAWDAVFAKDGSNDIAIRVTGAAATTIEWEVTLEEVERPNQ
jgi:hypothetical protein